MTYKSEAEITAAFINDGWSKNTAFTELSFDDAREIGKYFVDLMLKGTKLFRMNICGNVYDDTGKCSLILPQSLKQKDSLKLTAKMSFKAQQTFQTSVILVLHIRPSQRRKSRSRLMPIWKIPVLTHIWMVS